MNLRLTCLLALLSVAFSVGGQENFYDPDVIREIRIQFKEPNWRQILDSLFETAGDNGKLTGEVTIDGHTCRNSGIRYKGYSSYNANEIKNPFNIDLDYSIKNQNHLGHVKIKLSNVIQDPSFVREVLSYEIARDYLPASRANFANLYVNDTLIGLYTNVEAVDDKFIKQHWANNNHSFFKGEPVKLEYPFGENANLALTHGSDSSGYMPFYNMESPAGWNDLYTLIYLLDKGADSAGTNLNIDRALWMHAFNEVLLNLDSYIGYSQNYYLYRDDNGQFNPILWDMNMSFGSFRDSDGSAHFQGVTIPQIKQLDPLALMDFAVSPRPLMTKLFANDTLRKIYFAHMRTIVNEKIRNGWYFQRARSLQNRIDADVLKDTNRFYPYEDFHSNLTVTVGGTGSMKQYPGLKDLMESRTMYLDGLTGFSGEPVIADIAHQPEVPVKNEPCLITARVSGASLVYMGYRFNSEGVFSRITMADDGKNHDGEAGDGIFGAMLNTGGHTIQYYIYAENDSAGVLSPERAEYEFYTIQPMIGKGDVVLNEIQAGMSNEQWIELFNVTGEPLDVGGMRLSSDPVSSVGWFLPDTLIPAKKFLVIDPSTGLNTRKPTYPFTLPSTGGFLMLFNASGILIDSLTYGYQVPGKNTGRYPNGYGPMTYMPPTKGRYNAIGITPSSGFLLYPNPASGVVNLELMPHSGTVEISIYNSTGNMVLEETFDNIADTSQPVVQPVDISNLGSGLFVMKLKNNEEIMTKKLLIY